MANPEEKPLMIVEVAYARPDQQLIMQIRVPEGISVKEAIIRSGITDRFPEIDLAAQKVGIFGRLRKMEDVLCAGDRVEIYRELIADPKEVRKKRAAQGKKTL